MSWTPVEKKATGPDPDMAAAFPNAGAKQSGPDPDMAAYYAARQKGAVSAPAPQPKSGIGSYDALKKIAQGFDIQPSHGMFAPKTQQSFNPAILTPSDYTQNISRGANRGITPLTGQDIQGITAGIDAGAQSVLPLVLENNPVAPASVIAHGLQIANAFTGGLGSTLLPQTFADVQKAGDTGSPLGNEMLSAGENVLPYLTPAGGIALGGSAVSTATNVAEGNESPVTGAADLAMLGLGLKGFKAASAIEKALPRVAATVGVSEAMYNTSQAIHGQPVTLGGEIGAGLTALPFAAHAPGQAPEATTSNAPESPPILDHVVSAIVGQESGGNYSATNVSKSGTALGKYQVMDYNLPKFLKQAGQPSMTPKEYLASPDAQDAVGRTVIGRNLQRNLQRTNGDVDKAVRLTAIDHYGDMGAKRNSNPKRLDLHPNNDEHQPTPNQYAEDVLARFHKSQGAHNATITGQEEHRTEYQNGGASGPETGAGESALGSPEIGSEYPEATEPAQQPVTGAQSERATDVTASDLTTNTDNDGIQIDRPILAREPESVPAGDLEGNDRAQYQALDGRVPLDEQNRQDNTELGGARAGNIGGDRGGEGLRQGGTRENETPTRANNELPNTLPVEQGPSARGGDTDARSPQITEGVHYGERPKLAEITRGDKTTIESPTGNQYAGHYAVVDLSEITPSNDARNFSPHEDYPPNVQDRDYKNSHDEQAKVIRNGNDLKPSMLVNDSPVSDVGPPIVDSKGRVIGGNGRTMSLTRSFASDGDAKTDYKATLVKKAPQFGIDPEAVRSEKNPVLVRVMPEVSLQSDQPSAALVREMNLPQTTEKDATASAISAGNALSADQHEAIGAILEQHDTLPEAFADPATSKQLIRSLERGNLITNENRPRLIEQTKRGPMLSDAGKDYVTDIMASRVLPDVETARATPPAIKAKIAKAALPLAQAGRYEGWSLEGPIREAIEDVNAQKSAGLNDNDWKGQISFDRAPLSPEGEAMRNLLADSRQKPLREFAEKYAAEAKADKGETSTEMFEKPVRNPSETLVRLSERAADKTVEGRPRYTRDDFTRDLEAHSGYTPDARTATLALVDARAKALARKGLPSDIYAQSMRGITREAAPKGALNQRGTDVVGGQGEMFNARNKEEALAHSLSGISETELNRLSKQVRPLKPSSTEYAHKSSIDFRKELAVKRAEKTERIKFAREQQNYAERAAAQLGITGKVDAERLFKEHPDVEMDFLRSRQRAVVDALQAKYPDVKPGYGFFGRVLDAHTDSFNDPLVRELSKNHQRMLKLPEVPVRAAVRFGNDIALGRSHDQAIAAAANAGLLDVDGKKFDENMLDHDEDAFIDRRLQIPNEDEGFFTNHGRFVSREDAGKMVGKEDELHSEDTRQRMQKGEPVLYQESKGAVSFDDQNRALIHVFQSSDISTIPHELGHIFRRTLEPELLAKAEGALGVKSGQWDVAAEEKFADGFVTYLHEGVAPTPELKNVFQQFKAWLTDIFRSIAGTPLEAKLTPEMRQVFHEMLGGETAEGEVARAIPQGTLQSTFIPGADVAYRDIASVVQKELLPALKKGMQAVTGTAEGLHQTFSPSTRGEQARLMKGVMRENAAEFARKSDALNEAWANAGRAMDKLPVEARNDFIDKMERGQPQASEELSLLAHGLRSLLDERANKIQGLGEGYLKTLLENYFPRDYKDPEKAEQVMANFFAKSKPMEGYKGWLKQRSIEYYSDARNQGLELKDSNPVRAVLNRAHQMDKFLMSHQMKNEAKALGLARFRQAFEPLQPGERKIDDPLWTAYGNPKQSVAPAIERMAKNDPSIEDHGMDALRDAMAEANPETNVHGLVIHGYWVMPEQAADLANNFFSRGIEGTKFGKAFRGYRDLANVMNQFQLGWSAFHAGFVTMDAVTSRVALGIYQVAHGKALEGAGTVATSFTVPIQAITEGNRMMKEWVAPGSQGEIYGKLVTAMVRGGGRAKMDPFYGGDQWARMMAAWHDSTGPIEKVLRAGTRLPFALTEKAMAPLQQYLVPRMKMGIFAQMAKTELELLGPSATLAETREAMGKAWDSVDNRMGQLVYDNLFWDKTTKDLAMASVRSLGWNLGTFRELGGGIIDWGRFSKNLVTPGAKADFTHRMSYTLALPIVAGIAGATMQYLLTGKGPQELKDYFYPKTGATDASGAPSRVSLPSYMKDVYSYYNDIHKSLTIGGNPLRTVINKAHPAIAVISEMLENRDYYGVEIRHSDDPLIQQLKDAALFGAEAFTPFAARGIAKNLSEEKFSSKTLLPLVGITPAPREIDQSAAEQLMGKYEEDNRTTGTRTKAQFERSQLRGELEKEIRTGNHAGARAIEQSGSLSPDDIKLARKQALIPGDAARFTKLPLDEKLKVYEMMDPKTRGLFAGYGRQGNSLTVRGRLYDSYQSEIKRGSVRAEDAPALHTRIRSALRLPYENPVPKPTPTGSAPVIHPGIRIAGQ